VRLVMSNLLVRRSSSRQDANSAEPRAPARLTSPAFQSLPWVSG
jgi:hypothetical protein